jgi:hypothetical protein
MLLKHIIIRLSGILSTMLIVFQCTTVSAQSGYDLRINEILVHNDSNYLDDYGNRSSWVEIFNSAYNNVNMAGMYLTNDPKNPKKYWIPGGDPITQIAARNYLVFYADNFPTRGILHLNFSLEDTNYLALYDVNGRTLLDEITFPPQEKDVSYGRITDGAEEWVELDKTTPKANNYTGTVVTAGEKFVKLDPYGVGMAFIAMSVVFLALLLLYLVFKNTRRIYAINLKTIFRKNQKFLPEISEEHDISGEVNAAIAMALHLYISEYHDHEEAVLTIKKVARTYSPWSSKIYNLRRSPR